MRPNSRANRPGLAALFALGLAPAAAGAALPPPLDPSAHYRFCLDEARSKPAQALAEAEDWHTAGGGFPSDHCAAVALFELRRYPEAARRFEALAGAMMGEKAGLRADALDQAGQAWLLAGDAKAARAAFNAALQFVPGNPDLLIDRARASAEAKAWTAAIADLSAVLAKHPDRADALVYRASAYRRSGALARARADVDRALILAPDDAAGHLERGNLRRLQGDNAGARADWLAVERLAPKTPAARDAADNLASISAAASVGK